MAGDLFRLHGVVVPQALAAELGIVGVQHGGPDAGEGRAHPIAVAVVGGEVAHHQKGLAVLVPAEEGDGVGGVVIGAQPLEAVPGVVLLPEGGLLEIEGVHGLEEVLGLAVGGILEQVPVQGVFIVPLVPLGEFRPHEGELFPRVGHHVGIEGPDAGELLGVIPGHLAEEGPLHVDHLVVGEGQNIVL